MPRADREISSHPSHHRRTAPRSTRAQPAPSSQVTSSPEAQKRQFLEKKGLSAEEIDEAFKRAPAPAPAPASPVAPPAASVSPATDDAEAESGGGLRWTQVVSRTAMAIGALGVLTRGFNRGGTAGSAGAGGSDASLRDTARALEEARVAAERSAEEAAASRARSDELAKSLDDVRGAMERARADAAVAGANTPASVAAALDGIKRELRDELRGVVAAAVADAPASAAVTTPRGDDGMPESVREELAQIRAMLLASPLRETPPPGGAEGAEGAEGADVIVPPSKTTPRTALASSSAAKGPGAGGGDGVEPGVEKRERAPPPTPPGDAPPHPPSYMQVLEMLEKGQTPPGIRDIDDKPPDPDARIPAATMSRRRKPWEKSGGASGLANGGGDTAGGASGSPLSANGRAVEGGGGGGWRPPSVPSMSPDVSKVLMGRHGVGIPGAGGGGWRSDRGGWLAPGTPESEIQPAPGDLTPVKPSFDR